MTHFDNSGNWTSAPKNKDWGSTQSGWHRDNDALDKTEKWPKGFPVGGLHIFEYQRCSAKIIYMYKNIK